MNYSKIYGQLIESRKNRILEKDVLYEKHHILPKSMGGKNRKDNIVMLTFREHFLAHWLLWRIHRNRQTAYAFHLMSNRQTLSSASFDEARSAFMICHTHKGKTYEQAFGKEKADEMKEKRREHFKRFGGKYVKGKKFENVFSDPEKRRKDCASASKGTVFMYNDAEKKCRRVKPADVKDLLDTGWKIGRKMRWR